MMTDRGMERREFRRLTQTRLRKRHIDIPGFSGIAGVLAIIGTSEDWYVSCSLARVCIASPGYKWLQLSPDGGSWWLTVMYDASGDLVQYYFDVTGGSYISATGEPRFRDMYLDIVMQPDGSYELLDLAELDAAYDADVITSEQYKNALSTSEHLLREISGQEHIWRELCKAAMHEVQKEEAGE